MSTSVTIRGIVVSKDAIVSAAEEAGLRYSIHAESIDVSLSESAYGRIKFNLATDGTKKYNVVYDSMHAKPTNRFIDEVLAEEAALQVQQIFGGRVVRETDYAGYLTTEAAREGVVAVVYA